MKSGCYFKKLVSYGLIFSASFTLLTGGINQFSTTQAKAETAEAGTATELVVNELPKESVNALEKVTNLLDKKEIKKNFKRLVKTSRVRGTKNNKAAGKYIYDTVKGYGYDVTFQNFNGYAEKLTDLKGNKNKNQKKGKLLFKGRNIIAKRNNPDPKLKTVVFTANYDSRKNSKGALDNASGVVALMEMARILSDKDLPYNPEFVFFDSEVLRRGSRYYVDKLTKAEKKNIYCVLNVNCIGNSKQRKPSFYASDNVGNPLKNLCEVSFPGVLSDKVTETDATTFKIAKIPTATYYTLDFFTTKEREIGDKYVVEKDASLVDMDTLIYDTSFITAYATLLGVVYPSAINN